MKQCCIWGLRGLQSMFEERKVKQCQLGLRRAISPHTSFCVPHFDHMPEMGKEHSCTRKPKQQHKHKKNKDESSTWLNFAWHQNWPALNGNIILTVLILRQNRNLAELHITLKPSSQVLQPLMELCFAETA